jgi:hypothetical protein
MAVNKVAAAYLAYFAYDATVNTNDVVPMGWANPDGVLATFPSPNPDLLRTEA